MESHLVLEKDWQLDLDLSSRGRHLLKSGLWTDVEFVVGGKEHLIMAHRLVLASASPVFAVMLYGPSAEEKSPIHIPDVTLEIFNILLEVIYTDNIEEVTVEKIPDLENVSKKYLVPHLMKACAKTLMRNLTPNNAIPCYEFATTIQYQPLIDAYVKIFRFYPIQVLEAENALNASVETLEFIFALDCLSITSELDLLTFVEKYAKTNKDEKVDAVIQTRSVRRLLQNIRFLSLEMSELAKQHQRLRAFLTESDLLSLMINCSCEDAAPMPEGFSTNRTKRNITVPFVMQIPDEVTVGRVLKFVGIVNEDVERFDINLRDHDHRWDDGWRDEDEWDSNIMFHMSVRFNDFRDNNHGAVVVRNTYEGDWGPEERDGDTPFVAGEPFDLTIEVESNRFKVFVDGEFFCDYEHRLPFAQIRYFSVKGDVKINQYSYT